MAVLGSEHKGDSFASAFVSQSPHYKDYEKCEKKDKEEDDPTRRGSSGFISWELGIGLTLTDCRIDQNIHCFLQAPFYVNSTEIT